jgi:NAD(P)-dependent dehydrogenase (short-subunit alcohol dehydrogenase family)
MAADRIHCEKPDGSMEVMKLDLASLASIRAFAEAFSQRYQALHILCKDAGIMATPYRHTVDGFELQIGTNHMGHFALTGLLSEIILGTGEARVVTVTSSVHHLGRLKFDSFKHSRPNSRWAAYMQSKLANLFFAYELQRRFQAGGSDAISVVVNQGYSATNLRSGGPRMGGSTLESKIIGLGNRIIAMSAEKGVLGILYAAISP